MKTIVDSNVLMALKSFKVAKFTALYKVGAQGLNLPPFKGSTFRGVFGSVLKNVACTCPPDLLENQGHFDQCIFAYLFDTTGKQSNHNAESEQIPRPFVFSPPDNEKTYYAPGETFTLGFTLIGNGIEYLPYFIYTLKAMGEKGFGRGNHTVQLIQVFTEDIKGHLTSIYRSDDQMIHNKAIEINGESILKEKALLDDSDTSFCHQSFITPMRLKFAGKFVSNPEFHIILRNAVRRITTLLKYHHDQSDFEMEYASLFKEAEGIETVSTDVHWTDWERYSNRQKQRLKIGGIVGSASYKGDLQPFLPWLIIAGQVNIGKSATFGLGQTSFYFDHC